MSQTSRNIQYMDTAAAYDLWSEVYDTDGNFLQALDDIEMIELLPLLISQMTRPCPWRLIDLGCGTGRNTAGLLSIKNAEIVCLDVSPKMLDHARVRIEAMLPQHSSAKLPTFAVYDMMKRNLSLPDFALKADAIISTLVMEHVPLNVFFDTAASMLQLHGLLLITNMHADMGQISQAGFVDPKTQTKIRPASYVHTIEDVLSTAARCGFEIVGEVQERSIDHALAPQLGPRAQKWIGIRVWFGVLLRKICS